MAQLKDTVIQGDARVTGTLYAQDGTTTIPGLLSTTDKVKLDGIASGAEVNQNAFSNITIGSTTIQADTKTDTLTFVAGDNVTLTPDATNDKITIAATDTTYTPASATPLMDGTAAVGTSVKYAREDHIHPTDTSRASASDLTTHTSNSNIHITSTERTAWDGKYTKPSGGIPKTDLASAVQTSLGLADTAVQDNSYVHTDNNYTTSEKTKLAGIEAGAEVNTISSIALNGEAQTPVNKALDLEVVTSVNGNSGDVEVLELKPGTGDSSIIIERENTLTNLPETHNYATNSEAVAMGGWSGMQYTNLKFSASAGSTTMTYSCSSSANISFLEQFERLATAFIPNIYVTDAYAVTNAAQIVAIDTTTKTLTLASAYSTEAITDVALVIYTPTIASGYKSRAIGSGSIASGYESIAIGNSCIANAQYSFAVGQYTTASGLASFAEGGATIASERYAHAEGFGNYASGKMSHAEGSINTASGNYSHTEGSENVSSGDYSHTEGYHNTASAGKAHAEGQGTTASGAMSHTEGDRTIANHRSQHVFGQFNVADPSSAAVTAIGNYVEIVGNGTADNARSNARTLDWSGNEVLAGKLTVGVAPTANMDVATKKYVDDSIVSGQVQSDWDQTTTTAADYIKNKPNITTLAETAELSDAISSENYQTVSQAEKDSWNAKSTFSGNYSDLNGKPTIPTTLAQLASDTTHRVVTDAQINQWNSNYTLPSSGIPLNDLSQPVRDLLTNKTSLFESEIIIGDVYFKRYAAGRLMVSEVE